MTNNYRELGCERVRGDISEVPLKNAHWLDGHEPSNPVFGENVTTGCGDIY